MKEIANLIKLDFITIKGKSLLPYSLIMLALFAIMTVTSAVHLIIPYTIIFAGLMIQPAFLISEQCGYNKLYGVLPIKRCNIVFARFTFGVFVILLATIISLAVGTVAYNAALGENSELGAEMFKFCEMWNEEGITIPLWAAVAFCAACFLTAVEYTLLYVFGTSKEIPATLGFVFVLCLLSMAVTKIFSIEIGDIVQFLSQAMLDHKLLVYTALYAGGVAIMALGACISNAFFCKREL